MQFIEDPGTQGSNLIKSYSPGEIIINSTTYRKSLIIGAQVLIADWPPLTLAELNESHLDQLLALKPEVIILGVGELLEFLEPSLLAYVTSRKVGIEVMSNAAACRTYNVLLSEGRKVIIGLLLS